MEENRWAVGALPRTPLGSSQRCPDDPTPLSAFGVDFRRFGLACNEQERLKVGTINMCLTSASAYRPFITPHLLTFIYNTVLNFIPVSFYILLLLGFGLGSVLGLGLRFGIGNLNHI